MQFINYMEQYGNTIDSEQLFILHLSDNILEFIKRLGEDKVFTEAGYVTRKNYFDYPDGLGYSFGVFKTKTGVEKLSAEFKSFKLSVFQ